MTDTWPEDATLPVLPTTECPHCGVVVPSARYCGACGSDLTVEDAQGSQRLHSYAAFPDEPVCRISVVTSLFPHLSHHARTPFRVAFAVILSLLIIFSLAGATAPLVAVSSLGVALLFLLYVFEVDPYEETFVTPTVAAFVVGAGLGVGWALIGGHQVDQALLPSPTASLTSGPSIVAAVAVPVAAELLMCVPIVVIRLLQRSSSESLDGFVVGATSAVGFSAAATIVLLAPWFSQGQGLAQSFIDNLAAAIVRGVTFPLLSAMVTGLIGATVWASVSSRSPARGRWLTSPAAALVLAFAVQVGSAFANLAALPNAALVVVQLGAVTVGIVVVRIGLHHVLVHEAQGETIGPPRVCAHCNHLVPVMTFCPQCGIAERAIARWRRLPHWHLSAGPEAPVGGPPRPEQAGASGPPTEWWSTRWPTAPSGPRELPVSFPQSPVVPLAGRRLTHRVLLLVLVAGVALATGVFVIVAVVATPGPPPPCPPLHCQAPPINGDDATSGGSGGLAVSGGRPYTFADGFSLRVYPLPGTSTLPAVSVTKSSVTLSYPFIASLGGTATLTVVGGADRGVTPQRLVQDELSQIAPNATTRYVLPRAYVGYWSGYGAAFTTQVTSSSGSGVNIELIVLAAVHDGDAVTVTAAGRTVGVGPRSKLYNGHPSPAGVSVAYVSGETVNSITFPGSPVP